ncbi:hypothetical protein CYMTET_38272 [Cymbomonas tetramitiformis]|uniref:Apple domain-containing protein n=1 Tax=Cymbomonas tetramitiformis TaxID=36881 RepID=A0AAE0F5M6_9CHLO|nr:hypothetical protein CYMTET_38272 [Cymbomonas tetramitiformis]
MLRLVGGRWLVVGGGWSVVGELAEVVYHKHQGQKCSLSVGSDKAIEMRGNVDACATRCDQTPNCAGFHTLSKHGDEEAGPCELFPVTCTLVADTGYNSFVVEKQVGTDVAKGEGKAEAVPAADKAFSLGKEKAEAEDAAKLKAEAEKAAKLKAEEQAAKLKAEEQAAKLKAEEQAAKLKAEEQAAKLKAEAENKAAKEKAEAEKAAKEKAEAEKAAKEKAEAEKAATAKTAGVNSAEEEQDEVVYITYDKSVCPETGADLLKETTATLDDCASACDEDSGCGGFGVQAAQAETATGRCLLFKPGCARTESAQWNTYMKQMPEKGDSSAPAAATASSPPAASAVSQPNTESTTPVAGAGPKQPEAASKAGEGVKDKGQQEDEEEVVYITYDKSVCPETGADLLKETTATLDDCASACDDDSGCGGFGVQAAQAETATGRSRPSTAPRGTLLRACFVNGLGGSRARCKQTSVSHPGLSLRDESPLAALSSWHSLRCRTTLGVETGSPASEAASSPPPELASPPPEVASPPPVVTPEVKPSTAPAAGAGPRASLPPGSGRVGRACTSSSPGSSVGWQGPYILSPSLCGGLVSLSQLGGAAGPQATPAQLGGVMLAVSRFGSESKSKAAGGGVGDWAGVMAAEKQEDEEEVVYMTYDKSVCPETGADLLKETTATLDDCASACDGDSGCGGFGVQAAQAETATGRCLLFKPGCARTESAQWNTYMKQTKAGSPASEAASSPPPELASPPPEVASPPPVVTPEVKPSTAPAAGAAVAQERKHALHSAASLVYPLARLLGGVGSAVHPLPAPRRVGRASHILLARLGGARTSPPSLGGGQGSYILPRPSSGGVGDLVHPLAQLLGGWAGPLHPLSPSSSKGGQGSYILLAPSSSGDQPLGACRSPMLRVPWGKVGPPHDARRVMLAVSRFGSESKSKAAGGGVGDWAGVMAAEKQEDEEEVVYMTYDKSVCPETGADLLKETTATLDDCASACDGDSGCGGFGVQAAQAETATGRCLLFKPGCARTESAQWNTYMKQTKAGSPASEAASSPPPELASPPPEVASPPPVVTPEVKPSTAPAAGAAEKQEDEDEVVYMTYDKSVCPETGADLLKETTATLDDCASACDGDSGCGGSRPSTAPRGTLLRACFVNELGGSRARCKQTSVSHPGLSLRAESPLAALSSWHSLRCRTTLGVETGSPASEAASSPPPELASPPPEVASPPPMVTPEVKPSTAPAAGAAKVEEVVYMTYDKSVCPETGADLLKETTATLDDCASACDDDSGCGGFGVQAAQAETATGRCLLFKPGCARTESAQWNTYMKQTPEKGTEEPPKPKLFSFGNANQVFPEEMSAEQLAKAQPKTQNRKFLR